MSRERHRPLLLLFALSFACGSQQASSTSGEGRPSSRVEEAPAERRAQPCRWASREDTVLRLQVTAGSTAFSVTHRGAGAALSPSDAPDALSVSLSSPLALSARVDVADAGLVLVRPLRQHGLQIPERMAVRRVRVADGGSLIVQLAAGERELSTEPDLAALIEVSGLDCEDLGIGEPFPAQTISARAHEGDLLVASSAEIELRSDPNGPVAARVLRAQPERDAPPRVSGAEPGEDLDGLPGAGLGLGGLGLRGLADLAAANRPAPPPPLPVPFEARERRDDWVRVRWTWNPGVRVEGWLPASSVRPATSEERAAIRPHLDHTGEGAVFVDNSPPSPFEHPSAYGGDEGVGEAPEGWTRFRATLAAGTSITSAPDGPAWARTTEAVEVVAQRSGDAPVAALRRAAGLDIRRSVAWVPMSALE